MSNDSISTYSAAEALALLQWHAEAGADEAIEENAVNWFATAQAKAEAKPKPAPVSAQPAISLYESLPPVTFAAPPSSKGIAAVLAEARAAAEQAGDIESLKRAVENFDGCALKKLATRTVFADGNASASIMCIGEAPGADEDREGIPFCGVSGKLLDRMLISIGLDRSNAYITNSVFWRPPGNRTPTPDELEICRPFVDKHIALVKPKILVLVGGAAAKSLLNATVGVTQLRKKSHFYSSPLLPAPIPTYVIFHPSYLLRQPAHKALAWQDLLIIKHQLAANG